MAAAPDHARQAFRILHLGFIVAPSWPGWTSSSRCWSTGTYLAPVATDVLPVSAHSVMLAVGVVEIAAGVLVALFPRIGGYVVAVWLWAIIVNLLILGDYFDIALRDFGSRSPPLPWPGWPRRSPATASCARSPPPPGEGQTGVADRRLRVACPLGRVDPEAAEDAVRALDALGADLAAEGLADTPPGRGRLRRAAHPGAVHPHHLPQRRGLRRAGGGPLDPLPLALPAPPAPLPRRRPRRLPPASESSACPSWPGWWSCSPATSRPRSGSPGRWPVGSSSAWSRASGWWWMPSTCA